MECLQKSGAVLQQTKYQYGTRPPPHHLKSSEEVDGNVRNQACQIAQSDLLPVAAGSLRHHHPAEIENESNFIDDISPYFKCWINSFIMSLIPPQWYNTSILNSVWYVDTGIIWTVHFQSATCQPQSPQCLSQNTLNHLACLPSKQKSLQIWCQFLTLSFLVFFTLIYQHIYNQKVARQLEINLTFACTQTTAHLSPLLWLSLHPSLH